MEQLISRTFSSAVIKNAEAQMIEYGDDLGNLHQKYSICLHTYVCGIFCNEYSIEKAGVETERYILLEGLPRETGIMLQNTLCLEYGMEPRRFLYDVFDHETKTFIEIGITKRAPREYYDEKKAKVGADASVLIFGFDARYKSDDKPGKTFSLEQIGRINAFLMQCFNSLEQVGAYPHLQPEDKIKNEPVIKFGPRMMKIIHESVPHPYRNMDELEERLDNPAKRGYVLERVKELRKTILPKYEYLSGPRKNSKLRLLETPEGAPECEYKAKMLGKDAYAFPMEHTSDLSRPQVQIVKTFRKYGLEKMELTAVPGFEREKNHFLSLLSDLKEAVRLWTPEAKYLTLQRTGSIKFLMGINKTYTKVPINAMKREKGAPRKTPEELLEMRLEKLRLSGATQPEHEGPEPRSAPTWFQNEFNWMAQSTVSKENFLVLDTELDDETPIEIWGKQVREFVINSCSTIHAQVMSTKYIETSTLLFTDSNAAKDHIKPIPIRTRGVRPDGKVTDYLYGVMVKGKSHLKRDDSNVNIVTLEFSLRKPYAGKHGKYTVFEAGTIGNGAHPQTLYVYCRQNAWSKLNMKWAMEGRRALIQVVSPIEDLVQQSNADNEEDTFHEISTGKLYWLGTKEGVDAAGKLKDLARMIYTEQICYSIWNDSQLEGFCNEQKKFLMFHQAVKDKKEPFTFALEELYGKIEECLINNPYALWKATKLNEYMLSEQKLGIDLLNDPLERPEQEAEEDDKQYMDDLGDIYADDGGTDYSMFVPDDM